MGNNSGKSEYFNWIDLINPSNEIIQYDPRFEDINLNNNNIIISDLRNKLFSFKQNNNNNKYVSQFTSFNYTKNARHVGRRFDDKGLTLAWCDVVTLYCYDISNNKLYNYDLSNYLTTKYKGYNPENKFVYIPEKQIINMGNGIVCLIVCYNNKNNSKYYDITKFDIINKKVITSVNVSSKLFNKFQYNIVYWGFTLNLGTKNTGIIYVIYDLWLYYIVYMCTYIYT